MSMFRAKKLDLGCFINTRIIRDHTKRKVVEEYEPERCALFSFHAMPTYLATRETNVANVILVI